MSAANILKGGQSIAIFLTRERGDGRILTWAAFIVGFIFTRWGGGGILT